jgi:hypothetical protein
VRWEYNIKADLNYSYVIRMELIMMSTDGLLRPDCRLSSSGPTPEKWLIPTTYFKLNSWAYTLFPSL